MGGSSNNSNSGLMSNTAPDLVTLNNQNQGSTNNTQAPPWWASGVANALSGNWQNALNAGSGSNPYAQQSGDEDGRRRDEGGRPRSNFPQANLPQAPGTNQPPPASAGNLSGYDYQNWLQQLMSGDPNAWTQGFPGSNSQPVGGGTGGGAQTEPDWASQVPTTNEDGSPMTPEQQAAWIARQEAQWDRRQANSAANAAAQAANAGRSRQDIRQDRIISANAALADVNARVALLEDKIASGQIQPDMNDPNYRSYISAKVQQQKALNATLAYSYYDDYKALVNKLAPMLAPQLLIDQQVGPNAWSVKKNGVPNLIPADFIAQATADANRRRAAMGLPPINTVYRPRYMEVNPLAERYATAMIRNNLPINEQLSPEVQQLIRDFQAKYMQASNVDPNNILKPSILGGVDRNSIIRGITQDQTNARMQAAGFGSPYDAQGNLIPLNKRTDATRYGGTIPPPAGTTQPPPTEPPPPPPPVWNGAATDPNDPSWQMLKNQGLNVSNWGVK